MLPYLYLPLLAFLHDGCLSSSQVDPGLFRHLNTFLQSTMNGKGRMEVVNFAVMAEGITADAFASETIQTSTSSRGAAVVAHPSTSLHPTTQSAVGQQPSPLSPHSDALAAPAGVGAAATGLAPAATGPVGAAAVPTAVPRKSPGWVGRREEGLIGGPGISWNPAVFLLQRLRNGWVTAGGCDEGMAL
eukprot:879961-Pelagomonas_calceolata.AAC.6